MLFLQAEDQRAAAECLRLTLELDPKNQTARDLFVAIVQPRQLEKDHDQFHLKSHTKLMTTMAQVKGSTQHHPHQQQRVVMSSSLAGETVAKVSERLSELTGTPGFADMVGAGKVKASKSRPATQQNSAGKSRKV